MMVSSVSAESLVLDTPWKLSSSSLLHANADKKKKKVADNCAERDQPSDSSPCFFEFVSSFFLAVSPCRRYCLIYFSFAADEVKRTHAHTFLYPDLPSFFFFPPRRLFPTRHHQDNSTAELMRSANSFWLSLDALVIFFFIPNWVIPGRKTSY